MAEADVIRIVIEPMQLLFGEFGTDDADLIVKTYVRQFEKFDSRVLAETWDAVVADFMPSKRQPWPPIALIRKTAERVTEDHALASERMAPKNQPANPAWSPDAFRIANRLICSDLGRIAAREGWITQLHDYCRKARSMPDASAIARLKRQARLFEEAYTQVCRGDGGMLSASLLKLGDSMLARRDELAAKTDD